MKCILIVIGIIFLYIRSNSKSVITLFLQSSNRTSKKIERNLQYISLFQSTSSHKEINCFYL